MSYGLQHGDCDADNGEIHVARASKPRSSPALLHWCAQISWCGALSRVIAFENRFTKVTVTIGWPA